MNLKFKTIGLFLFVGFSFGIIVIQIVNPHAIKTGIKNYLELNNVQQVLVKQPVEKTTPLISDERKKIELSQKFIEETKKYTVPKAISIAKPAVVGIGVKSIERVYSRNPFDSYFGRRRYQDRVAQSTGSGFIVSDDGFVITNQHVIDNAAEVSVNLPDGTEYKAELIGQDAQSDIALLKISDSTRVFPVIERGDSDELMIGDWAIAIGNPFGLSMINNQPTVTLGIISALNRNFGHVSSGGRVYENMVQTDAAINSGNSGGPLVNILGKVIGMNTFIYTGGSGGSGNVGIAFSIPMNKVYAIIKQLKNGDIDRNFYIGIINGFTINKRFAKAYNVDQGMLIMDIDPNSPAYQLGLRKDDIILEANQFRIKSTNDFKEAIFYSGLKVGDKVKIKYIQNNIEKITELTLIKQQRRR